MRPSTQPRIALIHATAVAIAPIRDALASGWPEAEPVNILEDALSPDRAKQSEITTDMTERIVDLARYARKIGSAGVLFTCSAFGAAIETAAGVLDIPVLKPNEAMFEAAIAAGRNNAMIATFSPSVEGMEAEFVEAAQKHDPAAQLTSFLVEPAMTALRAGDAATHNCLIADKATSLCSFDAILLAHFSTSQAATAVRDAVRIPVFTSPDAAVAKLRRLVLQ